MSNKAAAIGKKNVVIVGGGSAGIAIARSLSAKLDPSKFNLVVINPLPYFLYLIASPRFTVSDVDNLTDNALMPYDNLFVNGNGELKVGSVVAIDESKGGGKGGVIALKSGDKLPYDILVLTPGSKWNGPTAFPDDEHQVTEHIKQWRSKYAQAKDILLVGGGAVGVETAGEIKDRWPEKNVTIVQGDSLLANKTYPVKFRKALAKSLEARGVKIIYDEYVDDFPTDGVVEVTTRSGKKLNADLVVATNGPRPNTDFVSTLGADTLTDQGTIKVKPTLQLVSHPDIYAAGDVIDWAEQKQAFKIPAHAATVVANVLSALSGQPPTAKYKGSYELIVVTNGKAAGVAYFGLLWGILLGGWFVRMVKAKDLLIPMARKAIGLA